MVDREGDQSSFVSKVCSEGHVRNMRNEILDNDDHDDRGGWGCLFLNAVSS